MIKPFAKNSTEVLQYIDPSKPVQVYRNLHKNLMSIRQNGIVKCHAENVVLQNADFIVGQKGRERVLREKKKNVHAFVKGTVIEAKKTYNLLPYQWSAAYYNPYTCQNWVCLDDGSREISAAEFVDIYAEGEQSMVLMFNYLYK